MGPAVEEAPAHLAGRAASTACRKRSWLPTTTSPPVTERAGPDPARRGVAPPLTAGVGLQRVQAAVVAADVQHAVGHRGRGHDAAFCAVKSQIQRAGAGVEGADLVVVAADVHRLPHDPRRRVDGARRRVLPPLLPGGRVDAVDVVVAAADVDDAVDDRGRGVEPVAAHELPAHRRRERMSQAQQLVGAAADRDEVRPRPQARSARARRCRWPSGARRCGRRPRAGTRPGRRRTACRRRSAATT